MLRPLRWRVIPPPCLHIISSSQRRRKRKKKKQSSRISVDFFEKGERGKGDKCHPAGVFLPSLSGKA